MARPVVTVTRTLPQGVEDRMAKLFDMRFNTDDVELDGQGIVAATSGADAMVPTVTDSIDADVIAALPDSMKLIANFGVGVNHLDLNAAHARGISVTNTPGVLTEDTADLAMALLLAVARRVAEGERLVRSGGWRGWTPTFMIGHRVSGKRIGIIGMGRIGQAVARRARGFGLSVHYHNRKPVDSAIETELDATYCADLDAMLGEMDYVSINCPETSETRHLMTAERLALLQPHAVLINSARGGIIDEAALAESLSRNSFAGAGLDVYEQEPVIYPKLLVLDNVVLVPHLGSATHEGRVAMGQKVIDNLEAFAAGKELPDQLIQGRDF